MEDLKASARTVIEAREALARAEVRRDDMIREALAAGRSTREVAEAAGLSVYRVYQVRDGRR